MDSNSVTVVGFGRRLVATIIDGFVVLFISFLLVFILGFIELLTGWRITGSTAAWNTIILITVLVFSVLYYVLQWAMKGETVGKVVLGMKIVDKDGTPPSLVKSLLRYVGYLIGGIVLSIGFIWVAIDKKHRGWHDLLAGTYVIDAEDDVPEGGNITFVGADASKGWVWIVIWAVIAIGAPSALSAMFFFLGPVMNTLINNWLGR